MIVYHGCLSSSSQATQNIRTTPLPFSFVPRVQRHEDAQKMYLWNTLESIKVQNCSMRTHPSQRWQLSLILPLDTAVASTAPRQRDRGTNVNTGSLCPRNKAGEEARPATCHETGWGNLTTFGPLAPDSKPERPGSCYTYLLNRSDFPFWKAQRSQLRWEGVAWVKGWRSWDGKKPEQGRGSLFG